MKTNKKEVEKQAGKLIILVLAAFIGVLAIILSLPNLVINLM
jgi:hypothetical protein